MTIDSLARVGELTTDHSGQLLFRLNQAQCSTCSASCHRYSVRELVVPVTSQVDATGHPVVLNWSRHELSKTALRVYGPPIAGLLVAVGVSTVAQFPDNMASMLVLAGVVGGMMLARLIAIVGQPDKAPEISFQPFNHDE